jgi:predicted GIY-YIG superfamily endonuclease
MFYTYILESLVDPAQHYIGHTEDLRQRLDEHNRGKCPHTAKRMPWRVKLYLAFETLNLARDFERYLKSGSGHAFAHRHLGL